LVWGGVVASAGLAVVSQITPLPATVETAPAAADAPEPAGAETAASGPAAAVPEAPAPIVPQAAAPDAAPAEPAPQAATAPEPTAPAAAAPDSAPAFDMADATAPDAPKAPAAPGQAPALVTATEVPPESAPLPATGDAARADSSLPDIDPPPPAPLDDALLAPPPAAPATEQATAPATAEAAPADTPTGPAAQGTGQTATAPSPEPAGEAAADPSAPASAPETTPETTPETAPQTEPVPEPTPLPQIAEMPAPDAAPPLPGADGAALPGTGADGLEGDASVATDRLPRIGDAEPLPEVVVVPEPEAPARPIDTYARPFEAEEGKPLFAILLADTGEADLDRQALAALPFPVTFVLDPLSPTAAEAAAIYRAGMQEVVFAATGLPAGATAADAEQTLQAHAAALPESVGLIDLPEQGFQDNRDLASALLPILAEQGRGLLTYERGLNTADQIARREGLPAATVFRRLDAEGESIPTMRRYLDRAAFRAAQEGEVVVIGRTTPDTVAAILEWSLEGRAASVTLAPASAVMRQP
jgi:polysaccharide deacetylase 2 family uncharacterized protein YibQ